MLRLDKVIKPWKESAALNDHISLYGFWNETAFLTKSGDLGMVLSVPGVDYESLDRSQQEYAVKRLEAALKAFGPGFHVYQYLFKSNRPDIPFATYDDPIVQAAIDQRQHEEVVAYAYRARSSTARPARAGIRSAAGRFHASRGLESAGAIHVFPPLAEL
jgi:type IV secretory pathway VirB4 component